jgi:hypothetical protein
MESIGDSFKVYFETVLEGCQAILTVCLNILVGIKDEHRCFLDLKAVK